MTEQTLDDLLEHFPADWDIKLFVCCRGETGHGPLGTRRWTAVAISRIWTHEEIQTGDLWPRKRLQTACCDTPFDAAAEAVRRIGSGEYDMINTPDDLND